MWRPHIAACKTRISGPKKFSFAIKIEFFNTIGTKRTCLGDHCDLGPRSLGAEPEMFRPTFAAIVAPNASPFWLG
jgi:hypothetical protein